MLKKIYVWEFPVRLTHWLYILCIAALSATGLYIGKPYIYAASEGSYIMGWMRFVHFVSAYALAVSLFIRIYWSLVGNEYSRWRVFFPFSSRRLRELLDLAKFYLFLKKEHPKMGAGHSACGSLAYLGLLGLFIVEIVTGFALYSQSHHGVLRYLMGGWLLSVMEVQTVRLYHHLVMWLFITFAIGHVYIAWYIDRIEKNGTLSSIFSGYKIVEDK